MKAQIQCQFSEQGEMPQCIKTATRKIGDHWFCEEHGQRNSNKSNPPDEPMEKNIEDLSDLCLTCGKEVKQALWGGKCKDGHKVVHQIPCDKCKRICGTITDDDYCGPEIMVCPDCMDKARK